MTDYVAIADKYIEDVLSGGIVASVLTKAACKRQKDDRKRLEGNGYYFDHEAANDVCDFVEKMPHIKGEWARRQMSLILEPWQIFILTTVFGWKIEETGFRRFRMVYIEVARKNAKSTLTSAVGLYMLTKDGEQGAECYSAATTKDQAKIVWSASQSMAKKEPEFREAFGVHVGAHCISVDETSSKYEALSAEGSTLDGLSTHFGAIDELHAHKTRAIFDVIETSTGSRAQSLLWIITTAGSNRAGICYEQRMYVVKLLKKKAVDETYFGLIYTLDKKDDWQDEKVWLKANPNLGVSLYVPDLARLVTKAMQLPSAVNNLLTKRFNRWVNADESWLDMIAWDKCENKDIDIDDFLGEECHMGLDLASKIDINAKIQIFHREEEDKYYLFSKFYLPEYAIEIGKNSQYQGWEREGLLISTPGRIIDLDQIEDDIREDNENFDLVNVGYDPHQATQLVGHLLDDNIEMVEVRPTVLNFSEPMKELEALVLNNQIVHNGCPIMTWMMANVVCHHDAKDNIYPRKEREENKIDGPVAAIMALHMIMHIDDGTSVYEGEVVLVLGEEEKKSLDD